MPDSGLAVVPKRTRRPYRIDPVVAHERASLAARVRNSPDGYITSLSSAELTTAQKRRLAELLMPFLAEQPAQPDPGETIELTCPVCHRAFPPKKPHGGSPQVYCSARCRQEARSQVRRDAAAAAAAGAR